MGADQGAAGRPERLEWRVSARQQDHPVHSRPGVGDVVAHVNSRRIIAECKKGPLVRRAGSPEYSLLTSALGQALLFDVSADDIAVAAVPDTPIFRRFAEAWRERPLVRRAGIKIVLVAREAGVSGLDL
jgi:hypothetical protein